MRKLADLSRWEQRLCGSIFSKDLSRREQRLCGSAVFLSCARLALRLFLTSSFFSLCDALLHGATSGGNMQQEKARCPVLTGDRDQRASSHMKPTYTKSNSPFIVSLVLYITCRSKLILCICTVYPCHDRSYDDPDFISAPFRVDSN